VGCFLNAAAVARFVRRALDLGKPVTLLCAGSEGQVSLEDALCAGLLLDRVLDVDQAAALGDGAKIAYALYRGSRESLARALFGAAHTRALLALGFGEDISYCARIDALDALPVMRDNRLVLAPTAADPA
jgi:2-phosphosulfolactate phosphatase